MFSALRSRYGIPGLIATVALVFAMTGGAFAAKYLITSTKQIKPSVLKALKGKEGPAGAAGAQGAQGSAGANGTNGKDGANGTNGANGKNVSVSGTAPGCSEGGITVGVAGEPATNKEVCNGIEGPQGNNGNNGEPWTAGGTLPVGSTETGTWALGKESPQLFEFLVVAPISYPIPLADNHPAVTDLSGAHAISLKPGESNPNCDDGNAANGAPSENNPEAASGYLCVFATSFSENGNVEIADPGFENLGTSGTSGALLTRGAAVTAGLYFGSFAVTG